MGIVSTLKWLWDPSTDEEKAYREWTKKTPMQRRTQELIVYVRNREEPFRCDYVKEDIDLGEWEMRLASDSKLFKSYLNDWLGDRGTKGIRIDSVWYSPESIVRIELGESKLEVIE